MQKRTLYISLLLVSCLLIFGVSSAFAQTVSFQSKSAKRCSDVALNITVTNADPLSAYEIVFEVTGDYSSFDVDMADLGFTSVFGPVIDGNVVRMSAWRTDCGETCLDASGGVVVGTINLTTADVCDGTIEIAGGTVTGGCCDEVTAVTALASCDPVTALDPTIVPGTVTITNTAPVITCPSDTTIHWGQALSVTATATDPDPEACEDLTFSLGPDSPGSITADGVFSWTPGGDDVCDHTVTVIVTDLCGATDECTFNICVENTPPEIAADPADTLFSVWGITLTDQIDATDPDGGPNALLYSVISFDGPTWFGSGLTLDQNTGEWTWEIGDDPEYLGDFELCVEVTDGANLCDPCSPTNADTACYNIHITGFAISIEKVHNQHQGEHAYVSIYLDSAYMPATFTSTDMLGGFDFLITYDASALNAIGATEGSLIDGKFEYFTYRFGPFGNCDGGCPSGMMRIVGLRETNDGVINPNHIDTPGELAVIDFLVTNDRNLGCQKVPVNFFWYDCGDNVIADETGNWTHMGLQVFSFEGMLITDPIEYGLSGPAADCFDTVYANDETFKNAPIGSIIFRNGGVDIICPDSIDDRGDVNMNGVANEIGDAVVFTNYFIYGTAAFTIAPAGQIAATEINGDGQVLTVADLVYLIRIIVGDAIALPKENPSASANILAQGDRVSLESNVSVGAIAMVFEGEVYPTLTANSEHMEILYDHVNGNTPVIIYSMNEGGYLADGDILTVDGGAEMISVEAAEYRGAVIKNVDATVRPEAFALGQNFPNPFNPTTTIELALPVASEYNISIYNVSGQQVAAFDGYSEAGVVKVEWNADNMASGIYFYKAVAGNFSATKKMVLLK